MQPKPHLSPELRRTTYLLLGFVLVALVVVCVAKHWIAFGSY